MVVNPLNRVVRRLTAAEGYLELGLPKDALDELAHITEPGPLVVPCLWMRGEALKALGRYDEAVAHFRQVARSLPLPLGHAAWQSLAECLQHAGRSDAAADISQTIAHLEELNPANNSPVREMQSKQDGTIRFDIPAIGYIEVDFSTKNTISISIFKSTE